MDWAADTINAIDERDMSALICMSDLLCGVAPMAHSPRPCINKEVYADITKARADLLGRGKAVPGGREQ